MAETATHDLITRRKLSDEVFDRIKSMISAGEFAPGDPLPSERSLMDRFGVGRPAIREAMAKLSNMGLISITHGERARVRQFTAAAVLSQLDPSAHFLLSLSPESLEHLKDARRLFERGVVRIAAQKANEIDIAKLRSLVEHQRRALGDADAFISADMGFHTHIADMTQNPLFQAISQAMLNWLKEYHTEMLIWAGKENLTLAEHEEIIFHIASGDADRAEDAMVRHLERSRSLYTHQPTGNAAR